ncbi:MAG: hypothetical protein R2735_02745 [Microthrixaceae bacterium]
MTELDHASILTVLEAHSVRFVVIGGIAAELRDLSLLPTIDLDITPARDEQNLLALADAFDELEAGLLTADEHGTWFPRFPTDNWAQYSTLHLTTVHGPRHRVRPRWSAKRVRCTGRRRHASHSRRSTTTRHLSSYLDPVEGGFRQSEGP